MSARRGRTPPARRRPRRDGPGAGPPSRGSAGPRESRAGPRSGRPACGRRPWRAGDYAAVPDLRELTAVFAGGCIGALARTGLAEALPHARGAWPWATFAVNVAGAALLGWAVE